MSSIRKNAFNQKLDISDKNFPALPSVGAKNASPGWPKIVGRKLSETAKIYKNGDAFDGVYDDNGFPVYGKIMFTNGNVYEGCVNSAWIKEDEDLEEQEEDFDEYYEEDQTDWFLYSNYGIMTYPDGKKFYGSFCFPDKERW
jgi:hypothetical protein